MSNDHQDDPLATAVTGRDIADLVQTLPEPEPTIFAYEPMVLHGQVAYLSGQIPKHKDGLAYTGLVGDNITLDDAKCAARSRRLRGLIDVLAAWETSKKYCA